MYAVDGKSIDDDQVKAVGTVPYKGSAVPNMQVKPVTTNSQLAQKGKPLYLQKCSSCHGEGGAGKETFARLAGQQNQYVENTLRRFRATANDKHSNGLSKRRSIIMESVSKSLLDNDINALAAYIAQLK